MVLISGPHRLEMLTQALDSIPIESSRIEAVHLHHRGGRWDWAPELRARYEGHPKVTLFEDPDREPTVAGSVNRAFGRVRSEWALILCDDDYMLREPFAAALDSLDDRVLATVGVVAFGWYCLAKGAFVPFSPDLSTLSGTLKSTPKVVTTLFNVPKLRSLGGFDVDAGGLNDLVALVEASRRFGALTSPTPVGVYRIHPGQISNDPYESYLPYVGEVLKRLLPLARDRAEAEAFMADMHRYVFCKPSLRDLVAGRLRVLRSAVAYPKGDAVIAWDSRTKPLDERQLSAALPPACAVG